MIEKTESRNPKYKHTTRYDFQIYNRIQNLSKRNRVSFNRMVNHLLSERLGVPLI